MLGQHEGDISDADEEECSASLLLLVIHCFPAILERRLPRVIVTSFCN